MLHRIIALLLGRLRMSVDDAIQAYLTLSSKALSGTKWFETQNYRTSKLEEVLREIICMRTGNGDYRMVSARSKCKVYVTLIRLCKIMGLKGCLLCAQLCLCHVRAYFISWNPTFASQL